jgi:hypothetical protein
VVEADGAPLAGVLVMALETGQESGESGRTDEQGRFRVGVQRGKSYALKAERPFGASGNLRGAFDPEDSHCGHLPQAFGGATEVRVVMPVK